jgi:hypothetical protein
MLSDGRELLALPCAEYDRPAADVPPVFPAERDAGGVNVCQLPRFALPPAADDALRLDKELEPAPLDPFCAPLKKCCCAIEWLGTEDGFTGRLTD